MPIRISGFSTGLDIDQLVKDLMSVKRQPLNKLNQQKTLIEWKREQYREISSKLVDFRNNKLFNYSLTSSLAAKKAVVTGDTSAVLVKASSAAYAGDELTIHVESLATAYKLENQVTFDATKTLKELKDDNNNPFDYDGDGTISFKINGKTIELDEENDTIATMIQKINKADAGVTAYIDSATGYFTIRSKTTGDSSTITIDDPSELLNNFNLNPKAGSDAIVRINGIQTTRSSNTFTENGVEITLLADNSDITIRVATDTDKIVELVKNFISEYNSILDAVNKKLSEARYRDYLPLTSEQKDEMSEKEIELWESKAKSGLLRNDSILTTMINEFRMAMITNVEVNGNAVNLTQFGITTGDYTSKGKLVISDEDKLRAAIENDLDAFIALFAQNSTDISATAADSGLFRRLYNSAERALDQLAQKAGVSKFSTDPGASFSENSFMAEELRALNNRIRHLASRLAIIENNYYKQFTAMEKAVSQFSAQSGALFGFMN